MKLFFTLLLGSAGSVFTSLFAQIVSCLSQQTDVSGNNATAIGPFLHKVKISRSQSLASNPTKDGVVLFRSYFFSFFLNFRSVKLAKRGSEVFFKTTLVNYIYLTSEKSNTESKSGLIGTLLAPCRAVQDIEW